MNRIASSSATAWQRSLRMHPPANVALLCNLSLTSSFFKRLSAAFRKAEASVWFVRQILPLQTDGRRQPFQTVSLRPATLCFIRTDQMCIYVVSLHEMTFDDSVLLFSGFSRPQGNKEEIMLELFLSAAERVILPHAPFPCLYRRFSRLSLDPRRVGNHRHGEALLPPTVHFPPVTA